MVNPDRLVHIMDWPSYLHYMREDKIRNKAHWRPGQINLFVADLDQRVRGLSDATAGAFLKVLLAYASAPLINPQGLAMGPRRLTVLDAKRALSNRGLNANQTLERLEQARLVAFGPSSQVESSQVEWSQELLEVLDL